MSKMRPQYKEIKATQEAAILLKLNGGQMDLLKFIKLLYNIEREALNLWLRPITFDDLFSLPHGQVLSRTYDNARYRTAKKAKSFWTDHLETYDKYNIRLIKECGVEKLSRAEINLIKEMFEKYKDKTPDQMREEHHNPQLFPEWKNPRNSSIETTYPDLLRLLGKTPAQIKEFEKDLDELAHLEEIAG
jgi:hypothetical protein